MLSAMWIAFIVVFIVAFAAVVTLVLTGMARATKRTQSNPIKTNTTPIPDSSHRNPNTHVDSDDVRIN